MQSFNGDIQDKGKLEIEEKIAQKKQEVQETVPETDPAEQETEERGDIDPFRAETKKMAIKELNFDNPKYNQAPKIDDEGLKLLNSEEKHKEKKVGAVMALGVGGDSSGSQSQGSGKGKKSKEMGGHSRHH